MEKSNCCNAEIVMTEWTEHPHDDSFTITHGVEVCEECGAEV